MRNRVFIGVVALTATLGIYLFCAPRDDRASYFQNVLSKAAPDLMGCPGCNIVVIAIDTLRADHLPFYGYQLDTAPFLSSIANKSSVFQKAYSASSWTAPSAASYFTSVLPSKHGVVTGFAATKKIKRRGSFIKLNRIPNELNTMGEFARDLGFTTIAVADNLNIGKEIGFDRGFEYFKKFKYQGATKVNAQVNKFLAQVSKHDPYFLYIHYMDPHEPFHRRGPWFKECMDNINRKDKKDILCAYNSEIRFTDDHIRKLFEKHNWLDNSIVIILSDHGEEFWDHGKQGHGTSLYTELIRVPFLIYHPAWTGRHIQRNVHTMDMLPTIAALANGPRNSEWQGRNLIPVINRDIHADSRPIISERMRHPDGAKSWSKRSLLVSDKHYIQTNDLKAGSTDELYDLGVDFIEKNNIAENDRGRAEQMAMQLEMHKHSSMSSSTETEIEVDSQLLDELKTLGYLD